MYNKMEEIRSYEDMEKYVRGQIEDSREFMFVDEDESGIYMTVSIEGTFEEFYSSVRCFDGEKAEEETKKKALLETESLFEITYEDAVRMYFSEDNEERGLSERFFAYLGESESDFWEAEYMAAMDESETEENIKKLAADLWKQWKEYELDE